MNTPVGIPTFKLESQNKPGKTVVLFSCDHSGTVYFSLGLNENVIKNMTYNKIKEESFDKKSTLTTPSGIYFIY